MKRDDDVRCSNCCARAISVIDEQYLCPGCLMLYLACHMKSGGPLKKPRPICRKDDTPANSPSMC
jgi:hypothetical protein